MKIHGSQHAFNKYQQTNQRPIPMTRGQDKDQLHISKTAKQMQQQEGTGRAAKIRELKAKVEANDYHIHYDMLAEKIIESWGRHKE